MRAEQAAKESNVANELHLCNVLAAIKLACSEGLYEIDYVDESKAGVAEATAYRLSKLGYITAIKDKDTIKIGW